MTPIKAAAGEVSREELARIIDPDAHFNDIPDVRWAIVDLQRRELAYQKADAVLARFAPAGNDGVKATLEQQEEYLVDFAVRLGLGSLQDAIRTAFVKINETVSLPQARETKSPPVQRAPHNSGERLPSSDAAEGGGEAISSTHRSGET